MEKPEQCQTCKFLHGYDCTPAKIYRGTTEIYRGTTDPDFMKYIYECPYYKRKVGAWNQRGEG